MSMSSISMTEWQSEHESWCCRHRPDPPHGITASAGGSKSGLLRLVSRAMDHADIRQAVRKLCAGFPGDYWRSLDRERAYPTEFVAALTASGFLGALIPEEFGGSGLPLSAAAAILEEIQ